MNEQRMKTYLVIFAVVVLAMFGYIVKQEWEIRDLQNDIKQTLASMSSESCRTDDKEGTVNRLRLELISKLQTAPKRLDLDSMRGDGYSEGKEDKEIKELMQKLLLKLQ